MTEQPPATPDDLFALLEELGIETVTHEHEAVFTVEESTHVTAKISGGHTKNLFVKDKKGNYYLIVAENQTRLPLNKIHRLIGAQSRLSFGSAEMLMELLGIEPGSVNVFAPMNDHKGRVQVIIDEPLMEFDQINCHPLTNTKTTTISRDDLLRFLESVSHPAKIIRLSAEDDA